MPAHVGLRRASWLAVPAILATAGFHPTALRARENPPDVTVGDPHAPLRVRASDARAETLLSEGLAWSDTFRRVVAAIEASDLIVYVETRDVKVRGQLLLVAATETCRYVRISIRTPGLDTEQIAALGHELWHAVELARATHVRSQGQLREHYEHLGAAPRHALNVETAEAQRIGTKVLYEARASIAHRRFVPRGPARADVR